MFKFILLSAGLIVLSPAVAAAGQTIDVSGTISCVNDKWDESEKAKGHKIVAYAGRCIIIPTDSAHANYVEDCTGTYEYLPDNTWKGSGACTTDMKGGNTFAATWEEGSALPDYRWAVTGGTGKYKGAKGGGTYKTEELTTSLQGGRKTGKLELP